MKVFVIEEESEEKAQRKLSEDLGISPTEMRCIGEKHKKFSFEVLSCPATVEVEISRTGMQAIWKRLSLPIGDSAPELTPEFLIEAFKKKGVQMGLKSEVISKELFRITKTPGFNETSDLNILIAEGQEPVASQTGRPQWILNLKLFEKNIPIYARKNEAVAKAPNATKGEEGFKVTGEVIPPPIEEQFRLNTGPGIETIQTDKETLYIAKSFGRLHYDQGVRLRLDSKVTDLQDGIKAAVETAQTSFTGAAITADDLLSMAKEQNIKHGFLALDKITAQIKATKKWPAFITVAEGSEPVDGSAGAVTYPYLKPASDREIDKLKADNHIVFPGEILAIVAPPKEPVSGQTVYGEVLKGRSYNEMPIYVGKNVVQEKVTRSNGTIEVFFKAAAYGKVNIDKDRVGIQNILRVSKDSMEVTVDLFPQKKLSFQDFSSLLRDADILFGFEKEKLDPALADAFAAGQRIENFIIARGKSFQMGQDAKIIFNFDPENFKEKGMFQRKTEKSLLAVPDDLLLTKILPIDAQEGTNVFREKIPVPKGMESKDIAIDSGKNINEVEVGKEGSTQDPLRIEYRAAQYGTVIWKGRLIDIKSGLHFDQEKSVAIDISPVSHFKTPIKLELIKKIAVDEGVKVDLDTVAIEQALRRARTEDGSLQRVTIAKMIEPKHGTDAVLEYKIQFNAKPILLSVGLKKNADETPAICDWVTKGDLLGVKTPPGNGEDGKSIFGRKLNSQRGVDEAWSYGDGIEKSPDGLKLVCSLPYPGIAVVENNRLLVRHTVKISKDKMSASVSIYPSLNPKFQPTVDKIISMLHGMGVKAGIKKDEIRQAIEDCREENKAQIDVIVAKGQSPTRGKDASFFYSIDTGDTVGELRKDGSIDFKTKSVFQNVRQGQLLLIKRLPTAGIDGCDVLGNIVHAAFGQDVQMTAGAGVEVSANGLEFRSSRDGIVEILPKSIQVIPGLLIPQDVSLKTGNIQAGAAQVFIRGAVLPDFQVSSEKEITIEKVAEACFVESRESVKVRGGIIGRNKGRVVAGTTIEALYIQSGATVEAVGDILIGSEITNSNVRTAGTLFCDAGAGTIMGGEICVYNGLRAKTIGAAGSETQTVIRLGENFFLQKKAEQSIIDLGLEATRLDLDAKSKDLNKQLKAIYDEIPEAAKTDLTKSQQLQEQYKMVFDQRKEVLMQIEKIQKQKAAILNDVPRNKDVVMTVLELIHPGVTIIYRDVIWVLKEPLKGVEIRWNSATSNLISKRI
ncbi:MAG: DUF342 domain-containing protein [Deltaproteobacteria bacterium]|nr:DUF342 domain-containing protein [Deltaproteobacteria bacterium]